MIVDCISDLHGHYPQLEGGDLLIVAGDLTASGTESEYEILCDWIFENGTKYDEIILIAGNHDGFLQKHPFYLFRGDLPHYCTYLCDSGAELSYFVDRFPEEDEKFLPSGHRTLKIWGSPWTKRFEGMNRDCMAFTVETEEELAEKWALIPNDIDILVTHSPPYGTMDEVRYYCEGKIENVGSGTLAVAIMDRPKIRLCVFGHIHESFGIKDHRPNGRVLVNASHVNERYEPVNKPIRVVYERLEKV